MNTNGSQATKAVSATTYAEKNPYGENRKARRALAAENRRASRKAKVARA